jgi:DNA-binding NtrC family response regulator
VSQSTRRAHAPSLKGIESKPDLILLDVQLPDGRGIRIAEAARLLYPVPRIIAMSGAATAAESFQLGQLNVAHFLQKPFGLDELTAALQRLSDTPEALAAVSAAAVGQLTLAQARAVVRDSMTRQALALAAGNRTHAADILGVTRQAVQYAVRDEEVIEDAKIPAPA